MELKKQLEIPGNDPNHSQRIAPSPPGKILHGGLCQGKKWFQTFFFYIVLSRNYVTIPLSINKLVPGTGWIFKRSPVLKPQPRFGQRLSMAVRLQVGLRAALGWMAPLRLRMGSCFIPFKEAMAAATPVYLRSCSDVWEMQSNGLRGSGNHHKAKEPAEGRYWAGLWQKQEGLAGEGDLHGVLREAPAMKMQWSRTRRAASVQTLSGYLSTASLMRAFVVMHKKPLASDLTTGLICSGGLGCMCFVRWQGAWVRKGRWYWSSMPLAETHGLMPSETQYSIAPLCGRRTESITIHPTSHSAQWRPPTSHKWQGMYRWQRQGRSRKIMTWTVEVRSQERAVSKA